VAATAVTALRRDMWFLASVTADDITGK